MKFLSRPDLEKHAWYRSAKVLFILSLIVATLFSILVGVGAGAALYSDQEYEWEKENTVINYSALGADVRDVYEIVGDTSVDGLSNYELGQRRVREDGYGYPSSIVRKHTTVPPVPSSIVGMSVLAGVLAFSGSLLFLGLVLFAIRWAVIYMIKGNK